MHNDPDFSTLLLGSVPLFSSLSDNALLELSKTASRQHVDRGENIVSVGETNESLYVILTGSAKVTKNDEDGKEIILSILHPRDFFGEMAMLDGDPCSANVTTLEATELAQLSKSDFFHCMENHFEVARSLLNTLVQRLREADRKIESLALLNVHTRVKTLLIEMATLDDKDRLLIEGRINKKNLARMVGASREMVSRVIRELESTGFLQQEDTHAVINPNAL